MIKVEKAFQSCSLQLVERLTECRKQARLRQADFRQKAKATQALKIKVTLFTKSLRQLKEIHEELSLRR